MKKLLLLVLGFTIGVIYVDYTKVEAQQKIYGARNIADELRSTTDRANLVLDTVEKKYIVKNAPKPTPPLPKPDISTCKCNGTGVITYADGNKGKCQCSANPAGCTCKPSTQEQTNVAN